MTVIRQAKELSQRKVCLAIGVFDGVHLGHQQVLRQTLADARPHGALAVAVTFDRHPNAVVAPDRTPPLVYSLPQKMRAIDSMGMDATLLIEFDRDFSRQPAEEFIRRLCRDFGSVYSLCVGANFTFGYKRAGNVTLLQGLGRELRFVVHGLAAVQLDGQTVSSTVIREAIREGRLSAASQMLGRPYAIAGRVVKGDRIGHRLGIPTANLDTTGLMLPPHGVYAGHVRWKDKLFQAALNIGFRPTLKSRSPELRVESHLLDFSGDLYNEELELTFAEKIRDERRFDSLEELKEQIHRDVTLARNLLS